MYHHCRFDFWCEYVPASAYYKKLTSLLAPEALLVEWQVGGDGVAVCCSVLQCVATCCSHTHMYRDGVAAGSRGLLGRVEGGWWWWCCSVLQCLAACCSMLQSHSYIPSRFSGGRRSYSVLQCVAVCCGVLQSHSYILSLPAVDRRASASATGGETRNIRV